VEEGLRAKEK